MLAWHFTNETLRDGSPIPPIGETLIHTGQLRLCRSGLHASPDPFDALQYALGSILHQVRLEGQILHGDDKVVATERTILASIDATDLLRSYARWCALQVIHLWNAPDLVRQYLETGEESQRKAAQMAVKSITALLAARAAWAATLTSKPVEQVAQEAAWAAREALGITAWTQRGALSVAQATQRREFTTRVHQAFAL